MAWRVKRERETETEIDGKRNGQKVRERQTAQQPVKADGHRLEWREREKRREKGRSAPERKSRC